MKLEKLLPFMEAFKNALPALIKELSDEQVRWKPPSGNWSILEIVCHLADEEVEDFRLRVQLTLDSPGAPWPPIDPEGVAVQRQYNDQDINEALKRFVEEREKSLRWLRSLDESSSWGNEYEHPSGMLRAGDVFAGWVAHDQLHLRQIAKRLYEMTQEEAAPFKPDYGGTLN